MLKTSLIFTAVSLCLTVAPCVAGDNSFKLALASHAGRLSWSADGYQIVQSSAKPSGNEIGIRARNSAGITFLGFLFLVPEQAPLTSAKCRDGAINSDRDSDLSLKIQSTSEIKNSGALPISLVSYTTKGRNGKTMYVVRGFVATADICGDLEFYGDSRIAANNGVLKNLFASYELDDNYKPDFRDKFIYAQILYHEQQFKAAAPIFESALKLLNTGHDPGKTTMRRVLTDQAGMAYGISGDIPKARSILEKAIAEDPNYPLYYYNLACADAEEKNLAEAEKHLREAYDRKANVLPGETMPDPTADDSFLPYHQDKEFWNFLKSLQSQR